jgi:hypothetical protein
MEVHMILLEDRRYFVYVLVDPREGTPFYVGKGKGNRPYDHFREAKLKKGNASPKIAKIRKIWKQGLKVPVFYMAKGLTEQEAFQKEFETFQRIGFVNLTNIAYIKGVGGDNLLLHPNREAIIAENTKRLLKVNNFRRGKDYSLIYGESEGEREKKKRRDSLSGRKRDPAIGCKVAKALTGNVPWNKGLTKADPRVRKNSIGARLGAHTRSVRCNETGEIFRSVREAKEAYGGGVNQVLIGRAKTCRGKTFSYMEDQ